MNKSKKVRKGALPMSQKCILLSGKDIEAVATGHESELLSVVEDAFRDWHTGCVVSPQKTSLIFDDKTQSRINCMPSGLPAQQVAGVKWVSVFPDNPKNGIPNVGGLLVLSNLQDGRAICVMDASSLTELRTAIVDALAAAYLKPNDTRVMAVLGTGRQARSHAKIFHSLFKEIGEIRIAGRNPEHACELMVDLVDCGVPAISCGDDYAAAVDGAGIVVTAISGQEALLKQRWLGESVLYCHVGGLEDEDAVAKSASKIICDDWDSLKHRGSPTIARMYERGILTDDDITGNLGDLVSGAISSREPSDGLIYFNAIGMSIIDVAVANWICKACSDMHLGGHFVF